MGLLSSRGCEQLNPCIFELQNGDLNLFCRYIFQIYMVNIKNIPKVLQSWFKIFYYNSDVINSQQYLPLEDFVSY